MMWGTKLLPVLLLQHVLLNLLLLPVTIPYAAKEALVDTCGRDCEIIVSKGISFSDADFE